MEKTKENKNQENSNVENKTVKSQNKKTKKNKTNNKFYDVNSKQNSSTNVKKKIKPNKTVSKQSSNQSSKKEKYNKIVDSEPEVYTIYTSTDTAETDGSGPNRQASSFKAKEVSKTEHIATILMQVIINLSLLGGAIACVCKWIGILNWSWLSIAALVFSPTILVSGIFIGLIHFVYAIFLVYVILIKIPSDFINGLRSGFNSTFRKRTK